MTEKGGEGGGGEGLNSKVFALYDEKSMDL